MTFRGVMHQAMGDLLLKTTFSKIARRLDIDDSDAELTEQQAKQLQEYLHQRIARWHWTLVKELNR